MASTGLFGSNVGGGRKRPVTAHPLPPGKTPRFTAPSVHNAPSIHVSTKSVPASLLKAPSSSNGSQSVPQAFSFAAAGQGTGSGGASSALDNLFGGAEGFIGHLGSDIVHTALGMPAGFAYLIEHPVAGVEGAAKMTWNDWSPLFHGDYRTWLHNTYEHPLAPILDVMSVVTGGAALAGRTATVAGRLGELASGADAAARSAETVATVVRKAGMTTEEVGKAVAAQGFKTSSTMEKFLRFGNPAKYSGEVYARIADNLGYTGTTPEALAERAKFISTAMNNDPWARRVLYSKGGIMHSARDVNKNPLIRARQRQLAKVGNAAAARSETLGKVVGEEAIFKRFIHMDIGSRRAAMVRLIQHQLATAHKAGQTTSTLTHTEIAQAMEKSMYEGITAHAHIVERKGAAGSTAEAEQLAQLKAEGAQLLRDQEFALPDLEKAWAHIEKTGAKGYNDFFQELWSKARTTDNPAEAHLSPDGHWMVVSRPDKVSKEAFFSEKVVRQLYVNPTKVWKYMLLGASPRYFVNNFVGNTLMLLAATDPVSTAKAFYSHIHLVFGAKKADRMAEQDIAAMATRQGKLAAMAPNTKVWANYRAAKMHAATTGAERAIAERRLARSVQGQHVLEKWYGAEYGFGQSNRLDENGLPAMGKIDKLTRYNLHGVTHKYADMPQRYMAMTYTLKRIPEYQQAYAALRAAGKDHWAAEEGAIDTASRNPAVRQMVRAQVNHMLGQYHTFTTMEHAVRNVIPFYAWDRAITKHMAHLVTQSPYKVAMGAAIGTLGNQKIEEIMGQVPDFLQSAIPAKLLSGPLSPLQALIGSNKDGRMGILNAYSLSPYGSVADLTTMALAATGQGKFRVGDSLGGQLNPLIQATASELSGVDLQTGAPVGPPTGGPIAGIYAQAFANVPQVNLLKAAIGWDAANTTKSGNPTLYEHDLQAATSSFLGLAIRQVNLDSAHAVAQSMSGQKKHAKDHKYNPFPGL